MKTKTNKRPTIIGYVVRFESPTDASAKTEPLFFGNGVGDSTGGPDCRLWFHTHSTLFHSIEDASHAVASDQKRTDLRSIYRNSKYIISPVYAA